MKHKHHIIPKHMGGTNDASNLIDLTIEEHAEAHRLLYEQYGKKQDFVAYMSLLGLADKKDIYRILLEHRRGKPLPKETREKIAKGNTGKRLSQETKPKMSLSKLGKARPDLLGNKQGCSNKGRKKDPAHQALINERLNSIEVKQKISATWKSKPLLTCPHCGTQGTHPGNMSRYHFESCKENV